MDFWELMELFGRLFVVFLGWTMIEIGLYIIHPGLSLVGLGVTLIWLVWEKE